MSRNKPVQKLTAMILSVIMVMGMTPVSMAAEAGELPIGASGEIAAFAQLAAEVAAQSVPIGTSEEDLELPGTLTATVRLAAPAQTAATPSDVEETEERPAELTVSLPVTWVSSPPYNGDTGGEYVFLSHLPEGFTPADGVELPAITIMVHLMVKAMRSQGCTSTEMICPTSVCSATSTAALLRIWLCGMCVSAAQAASVAFRGLFSPAAWWKVVPSPAAAMAGSAV